MLTVCDTRRWLPVDPPVTNDEGARSPELLRAVVAQFDVARNPRYARSVSATWCNIFLWDVTRALGCEIPHWIDPATGDPSGVPCGDGKKPIELTANGVVRWLYTHGFRFGWSVTDRSMAGAYAARGCPVAAVWANIDGAGHDVGPGHVAILLPPSGSQVRIAQAGGSNFSDEPIERGFGRLPALFYAHA